MDNKWSSKEQEMIVEDADADASHEENNIAESPGCSIKFDGVVATCPPSSSKRRRAIEKRVVHIPLKERGKGESNTPPSDSWAWRKYGQKPIKGSPYPRGYYRCSSSKGCPARKQVERSRVDPTMLVVTYSSDHNHPSTPRTSSKRPQHHNSDPDLSTIADHDDLGWFTQMAPTMLWAGTETGTGTHIFSPYHADVASVGEVEDSLFADLGELPDCSLVFRYSSPFCGTTPTS